MSVGRRIIILYLYIFVPQILPKVLLRMLMFLYSVLKVGEDTGRTYRWFLCYLSQTSSVEREDLSLNP